VTASSRVFSNAKKERRDMEFYESEKELKKVLVNDIIPFVNADPDSEEVFTQFVEANTSLRLVEEGKADYFKDFKKPQPDRGVEMMISVLDHNRRFFNDKHKEIKELHFMLKTMLIIAFRGFRGQSIDDIPSNVIRTIEKKMNEIFKRKQPESRWRGMGGNYVMYSPKGHKLDPFSSAAGHWINCVTTLFDFYPDANGKPEFLGDGYSVVGMCPNCGIFFGKKRKDQEYCSRNCQVVASNRQRRQFKKT